MGLYCEYNQLSKLDLSKNTNLTTLNCEYNCLVSLNISKCIALKDLSCGYNQLPELDVSACTALLYLYCHGNLLTELDVSNNVRLHLLSCADNSLTTLDFSKNTNLGTIWPGGQAVEIAGSDLRIFDMHCLMPEEDLKRVSVDSDYGTYDPETGLVTLNSEMAQFRYDYNVRRNGVKMGVYVTLVHNHTYGEWKTVTPATINAAGESRRYCTVNGCTAYESKVLPQLEHTHDFTGREEIVTPASCTAEGSKKVYCTNGECGEYTLVTLPKTGHTAGEWQVDGNKKVKKCTECGKVLDTVVIDENAPTITVETKRARAGKTVLVDVILANNEGIQRGA